MKCTYSIASLPDNPGVVLDDVLVLSVVEEAQLRRLFATREPVRRPVQRVRRTSQHPHDQGAPREDDVDLHKHSFAQEAR